MSFDTLMWPTYYNQEVKHFHYPQNIALGHILANTILYQAQETIELHSVIAIQTWVF